MKRKRKKLSLTRRSVRILNPAQTNGVRGGALDTDLKCSSETNFSNCCDPTEGLCTAERKDCNYYVGSFA